MLRYIVFSIALFLLLSCQDKLEPVLNKTSEGVFKAKTKMTLAHSEDCEGHKYDKPTPFTWCLLENAENEPNDFSHSVFLLNKTSSCGSIEEYFPVALLELTSTSGKEKVVIGTPFHPDDNPKEVSDFFQLQMNFSSEMKALEDWIEMEWKKKWIVTAWENEKKAQSYLDRLNAEF